jgi:hypothetical protein
MRTRYKEKAAIAEAMLAELLHSPAAPLADPDGKFAYQRALQLSHKVGDWQVPPGACSSV